MYQTNMGLAGNLPRIMSGIPERSPTPARPSYHSCRVPSDVARAGSVGGSSTPPIDVPLVSLPASLISKPRVRGTVWVLAHSGSAAMAPAVAAS